MNLHLDHRETSDTYRGELFRYGRYRVIMCKDGIQWILQRQKKGAGARWAALSYCTTRDSLRRVWTTRTGGSAAEIDLLPDKVRGSDDAGRKAAKVLARRASTLGWDVSLLKAPEGQDWNDVLMGGAA